jgi:hypothetical protein
MAANCSLLSACIHLESQLSVLAASDSEKDFGLALYRFGCPRGAPFSVACLLSCSSDILKEL